MRLLRNKGWFPEGEPALEPDTIPEFLGREGDMIFCRWDPAPAVEAVGRTVPAESEPFPVGLLAEWTAAGIRPRDPPARTTRAF